MLYHRKVLERINRVLPREEFIILTGPRQAGKTSILTMLKAQLEEKGQPCSYLNLENPQYLKVLNKHPFNLFELIPSSRGRQNVFIDEVQYLDEPTNFLKLLYDEKRGNVKIIASGSSAFYIDKKFKDSLSGRKFLFEVLPLNFDEFLVFNRQDDLLKRKNSSLTLYYKQKLLALWEKYLAYGGYPKVALAENDGIRRIVLEEIGSSYIKKDITDAGIKNTEKYFSMLKILSEQTGQLVNSQELANTLKVAHKTVDEYLYVMKKSYQVAFIRPFYKNLRKELTKMPKVYFFDLGLRNYFLNDYNLPQKRQDKGAFLENIVFQELLRKTNSADKIKFWRTQGRAEVDFVVDNEAFEVKFDSGHTAKKPYREFIKQYPQIKFAFLAYKDILEKFYGWR
ncbi:MAG: ATP-binding protein [Candidatus Omnitrophota bacterium]